MRDLLLVILVFGTLPIILFRPQYGIILWCWLGYMNPQTLAHGFARGMRYSAFVAAFLIVGLFVSGERKRFPWSPLVVVWLLWIVWQWITTSFALYPDLAEVERQRAMKIQFMTLCILLIMWTRPRIEAAVWVVVLSLGYFGVRGGLMTLLTGGRYIVWGPDYSYIAGNNELGLALVMILPLMRYIQLSTRFRWVRYGVLGAMALSLIAVIGTYSRGAFLAASAMGMALAMKSRYRLRFLVVTALLVPLALGIMPDSWYERMGTIKTYEQDASAMSRINSWKFAVNLANDRPMLGGGYKCFQESSFALYAPQPLRVYDAHSIYFQVLAEHGYVGLALFLTLGLLSWKTANRNARLATSRPDLRWAHDLSRMLQVGIIGYAVGGAFLGLAYFDLPYHLIALVVVTNVAVKDKLAEDTASGSSREQDETHDVHIVRAPAGGAT